MERMGAQVGKQFLGQRQNPKRSKANTLSPGGTRPRAHFRLHLRSPSQTWDLCGMVTFGGKELGWRRLGALGTVLGLGWGWGRCLKEEVGRKQRAPAGSGMSLAVPFLAQRLLGQVCPPEQNKGTAKSASVLASGVHTHPERYLSEPTPHSETLQPTSPRASRGGAGSRRNEDNCIPRPDMPAFSYPPRR